MGNNIIKSGSCLDPWVLEDIKEKGEDLWLDYALYEDGTLKISGNTTLTSTFDHNEYDENGEPVSSIYTSRFKDLDFHTVIIEEGVRVLEKECFKDCRSFRRIVLPEKMPEIRKDFADGSPLEYTEKDGLLFLGPSSNPLYFLMGCKENYDRETLVIPEEVVFIADEAFKGKKCIKEVVFPSTLEFAGWYTFDGTSIKDVFIPEGKMAYDETLLAFDGQDMHVESISVPYSMYKEYRDGNDDGWVGAWNSTAKIIFRNPDNSIAEILESKPLDYNDIYPTENLETDIDKYSDELPF